jgi:hypothetical protein
MICLLIEELLVTSFFRGFCCFQKFEIRIFFSGNKENSVIFSGCDPKFLKNLKFAKKHNLTKAQIAKKASKNA